MRQGGSFQLARGLGRWLVGSRQQDRPHGGRQQRETATSHQSRGDGGGEGSAAQTERRRGGRQAELGRRKQTTRHSLLLNRHAGRDQVDGDRRDRPRNGQDARPATRGQTAQ